MLRFKGRHGVGRPIFHAYKAIITLEFEICHQTFTKVLSLIAKKKTIIEINTFSNM
jgi:hypothetical protein